MSSMLSLSGEASHAPDHLGGLGQEGGGIDMATPSLSALISTVIASTAHDEGQGLVEYSLVLMLIALVAIGALGVMSGTINGILSQVGAVI